MTFHRWPSVLLVLTMLWLSSPWAQARPHQSIDSIEALDEQIEASLDYLSQGNITQARLLARQMAWRFPDYAVGQLISAELESTAAFNDVAISDHLPIARNVSELLLEARQRLNARHIEAADSATTHFHAEYSSARFPGDLIQIGAHLSQLVVVDLETSILYQYETAAQQANLVRQHYVASGEAGFGKRLEGDLKTPLGIYAIDGYRLDDALPDLYGSGALTLNYPNALDQYLGRTGYGIWLHGVPTKQRSRTPYSSEGCVTMSNEHLTRLFHSLDTIGTRVILTDDVTSLEPAQRKSMKRQFRRLFAQYQRAWIAEDMAALNDLYSDHDELERLLASGNNGLVQVEVGDRTTQDAPARFNHYLYRYAFSNIKTDEISIFRNPDVQLGEERITQEMVIDATFGNANEHRITIYWSKGPTGDWQVLTETLQTTGTGL